MQYEKDFLVDDDSGLLSLVDASSYSTFIGEDWEYGQILEHFKSQMQLLSILVWDAGDGGDNYLLRVRNQTSKQQGFREITGSIKVNSDRLHLASYTALTMAAQFADYSIPAKSEEDQFISVAPGEYRVRIVQMYDPSEFNHADGEPHFLLEYESGSSQQWQGVAWNVG